MADLPFAVVLARDVITIEGPDAETYLQGQLSQDVAALDVGTSAWTFALQPQGKVDAWFRLSRVDDDRFVADVDEGYGEALLARLQRFLLRTKANLALETVPMVAVRGVTGVEAPEGVLALDPAWPDVEGVDLLGEGAAVPETLFEGNRVDYETLRIAKGVPAMGRELTESTIPAEAGVVERSVSFTKGCFTGQELVARIDSRGGNVPRHLRRVIFDGDVEPGTAVVVDGAEVGQVTSAVPGLALAYVKRAVEPPVDARVGDLEAKILP